MSARTRFPSLGIDIVEIDRVAQLAKNSKRFLTRVFSKDEIRYCHDKKKKWQHFAVRFAAKEAIWKAVGQAGLNLKDIAIRRGPSGRPSVVLEGRAAPFIQVSLTHTEKYAAAVAVYMRHMTLPNAPARKPTKNKKRA
ncbi:MAG: holo-ACP synthase [Elusimicrobiota bacterium]